MIRSQAAAALASLLFITGCFQKEDSPPGGTSHTPATADSIKLTTWNLKWFPGGTPSAPSPEERQAHISSVVAVLKDLDPDILCVQEVKEPAALADLAAAMPGHSLQVVSDFKGTQEVAILSRHPAEAAFMEPFAEAVATPPRGFAYAAFRIRDQMLCVYTVHLKANSGGIDETAPKREESARQLVAHADEMVEQYGNAGVPCTVILSGDFNHDPQQDGWANDDTFRILLDAGFTWTGEGASRKDTVTWLSDGRYPDAAFDHVLVRAAEGVEVGKAVTEKTGRDVSDHRPLSIRIELP